MSFSKRWFRSLVCILILHCRSFSDTIKLVVGSLHYKPTTFIIHKDLLCAASPFFEAGCKPVWQDGAECAMELPEDDPEYFASLAYWVYNNEVAYPDLHHMGRRSLHDLSGVYLLAEKYQMPRLQNDLIDAMVYETVTRDQCILPPILSMIFDDSPPASKLRLFAVNCTLNRWSDFKAFVDTPNIFFCPDFLFAMFSAFAHDPKAALKEKFLDFDNQFCELYHIHEAEQQGQCRTLKLPEHVCGD